MRVVILAAGKGTRLKSALPKVLHPLFGKPLLVRVLETISALPVQEVCVVTGHGREQVEAALADWVRRTTPPFALSSILQEPQLGTGHALQQVTAQKKEWCSVDEELLILSGDVPLLTPASLNILVAEHRQSNNDLTVLTACLDQPAGYGRVIEDARAIRIVEEKDATPEERLANCVNTGIYCMQASRILPLLEGLSNQNAQGEFYLTDIVQLASARGLSVGTCVLADADEMTGINSRTDLALCHDILNRRTLDRLMRDGVTILQPCATWIAPEVAIGPDSTILPGCMLTGEITIGSGCVIGPHTTLSGRVTIGDEVRVTHSVVRDAVIGDHSAVGPFAQIRDGVEISHHVMIGNFVEVKKSRIDHHTNAAHLAYLGDATLGSEVNIGAGTITANYDPIRDSKSQTILEDGVKVGSNSVLIAPVTVGAQANVAAGSVITHDVPPGDLAIARVRQTEIAGWVARTRARHEASADSSSPA